MEGCATYNSASRASQCHHTYGGHLSATLQFLDVLKIAQKENILDG